MTFIHISGAAVFLYRKDSHRLEGVSTKQALHSLWSTIDASLALTIAKKLGDELGGTISSRAGKGTTFQIFLPRAVISH